MYTSQHKFIKCLNTKKHAKEYPTMHYFGIPRDTQSNANIKNFDSVYMGIPVKMRTGNVNCIPYHYFLLLLDQRVKHYIVNIVDKQTCSSSVSDIIALFITRHQTSYFVSDRTTDSQNLHPYQHSSAIYDVFSCNKYGKHGYDKSLHWL